MALLEDRMKSWPVGVGLLVLAVSAGPKLVKAGRPFVKRAIKGYLAVQDKAKETVAESTERVQDLFAEAKHEYEQEQLTARVEADIMPEPTMTESTEPAEGAKRPARAKKAEPESAEV